MLIIPTYIASSKIHGMGVFTNVDVKKDTVVWEFNDAVDQKFSDTEFNRMVGWLSKENADKFRSWTYYENGIWMLCGDNAKFFNHSENDPTTQERHGIMYTTAKRDLKVGDELTCNYKDFDDNDKLVKGNLYE